MAVKVYLAGKISDPVRASWRDHLLTKPVYAINRQRAYAWTDPNSPTLEEWGGPAKEMLAWPTTTNRYVLGEHEYVGPYLIDATPNGEWNTERMECQSEEHGSRGWGTHGSWDDGSGGRNNLIYNQCFVAVRRCDVLLAYLDGPDLSGTLIEIGWALAWDKVVTILVSGKNYDTLDCGDVLRSSGAHLEWDEAIRDDAGTVVEWLYPLERSLFFKLRLGIETHEERTLATMPYPAYLKTAHWQDVRSRALVRAAGRCQLCGTAGSLDVHHNTYERRGAELPSDVVALCRSCHTTHHGRMAH